jgi:peptidoglycan hydrolase-like protein with peptidoglycan-binding domain
MSRKLYFVFFILFLTSACAITAGPETPTEEGPIPAAVSPQPDISNITGSTEPVQDHISSFATKAPSRDEIRLVQGRLRTAGFDPGPADGVIGSKTVAALQRLQSACAALSDLLDLSGTERLDSQESKSSAMFKETSAKDEIRLMQARLRTAGFDPGPVDGIIGVKTKSSLLAVQSGCASIKDFPVIAENQGKTVQRQAVQKSFAPVATMKNISMARTPGTDEIQLIQVRLKDAGFDPGPIDGILGTRTQIAIQRYRSARGLRNTASATSGIGDMFE